jgi:hypothetical protein
MALMPIFVVYIVTRWSDWAMFLSVGYRVRDFADFGRCIGVETAFWEYAINSLFFDISMLISDVWSLSAVGF